jgi:hypothetical protein
MNLEGLRTLYSTTIKYFVLPSTFTTLAEGGQEKCSCWVSRLTGERPDCLFAGLNPPMPARARALRQKSAYWLLDVATKGNRGH